MKKIIITFIVGVITICVVYTSRQLARPVEIIAVHQQQHWSHVLVKNFPFTARGKVKWWEANRMLLKEKYGIPVPTNDGWFSVTFWDFGEGYEVEKPDENSWFPDKSTDHLYCFTEMKVEARCIRKKGRLMKINFTSENLIRFTADGETFYQHPDGKIIKGERFTTTIK
ncbi:DUF943 family protein [Erwiniaceae bacterium BAC15a-03b]|uniref:DUF943 family protein n=1 Tax=Winslowiella arboricola TaxID=2978220 RepID=A0A9J6PU96_9GAMM|nr:DUF943 family protein [Winslowiella arboricola]MCU5771891.1 DUF943 family protein [Winslowiella arboricola]MCU5778324.1 DUF943 family protein [Winslowiella arboricola]